MVSSEKLGSGRDDDISFTYTIGSCRESDTATESITITGVNDEPVLDPDRTVARASRRATSRILLGVPVADTDVTITGHVDGTE